MSKHAIFEWTDRQEASFCDIRDVLCSPPVLGYPDRNKPIRVILDADSTGLGYILMNVNEDGSETQLYYGGIAPRAPNETTAQPTSLAALLAALKAFHSYLINTEFEIVMDHISLTYLKNLRAGPSKSARASVQLSQFKFRLCRLAGKINSPADAISRTENLPTDPLMAKGKARYEDDDILDLQLTSRHLDETTTRDVGTQCNLNANAPQQDIAIVAMETRATRSNHIALSRTEPPSPAHAKAGNTAARDELTGNNKRSSSRECSNNASSGTSSGEDGDRQQTATDGDFGNAEISLHTKARQDT